ncbi:hypothetical protein D3C87_1283450 [compost metagenome]
MEEGTLVQVNRVGIFEVNTISVELLWQMVLLATGSTTGFGVTVIVTWSSVPGQEPTEEMVHLNIYTPFVCNPVTVDSKFVSSVI